MSTALRFDLDAEAHAPPTVTDDHAADGQRRQRTKTPINETASPLPAPVTPLTFPTVLRFLQKEFRRFDRERNEWALEKAEWKARWMRAEAEKRAWDTMKGDLLRRIEMLENVIQRERNGEGTTIASLPDAPSSTENNIARVNVSRSSARSKTRAILRKYLEEVGYQEEGDYEDDQDLLPLAAVPVPVKPEAPVPLAITTSQPLQILRKPQPPENVREEDSSLSEQSSESGFASEKESSSRNTEKSKDGKESLMSASEFADTFHIPANLSSSAKSKKMQKKMMVGKESETEKPPATMDAELLELTQNLPSPDGEETSATGTSPKKSPAAKQWKPKFTLRNHLDTVRSVLFHPNDACVLSAAEDGCIKYWNFEALAKMKKPPQDVEPIFNFRGHQDAVYALALSTMIPTSAEPELEERLQYGVLYSGGNDATVRVWGLPDKSIQPYASYDHRHYSIAKLTGHTDAVWSLDHHPMRPLLASASADGTVRIWNMNELETGTGEDRKGLIISADACKTVLRYQDGPPDSVPTCVEFIRNDMGKLLVGFTNGGLQMFDVETGKVVVASFGDVPTSTDTGPSSIQINCIRTHSTMPMAIAGQEDRHIRFLDLRTNACAHSMVAHLDAVSSLDISPNGAVLVSGGHDSSVRLWDINTRQCMQEFSAHRKKYDEAIWSVRFHPRLQVPSGAADSSSSVSGGSAWLATGGADACVKVYRC